MSIQDLLKKDVMIMNLQSTTKPQVLRELVQKLADQGYVTDVETVYQEALAREAEVSTGLGDGLAIPHVQSSAVTEPVILFAKSPKGIEYEALDGKPVYIFSMIVVPASSKGDHLKALSEISKLFLDRLFIEKLKIAKTPDDVEKAFVAAAQQEQKPIVINNQQTKMIVAVTACPTGIAHTFMAEEALIKAGKELGVTVRVETNGSEGVANELTPKEISQSMGVILAADKNVEKQRFAGKPLVERSVSDGIKKPQELIQAVLNNQAPIYQGDGSTGDQTNRSENTRMGNAIYKSLMNGVSFMLPFVVGGGIFLAISFLVENTLGGDSPLFEFFNSAGSNAFSFLIPILAGYIAISIGDRPALMPGIVGGLMAVSGGAGFLGGLAAGFIAGYGTEFLKKLLKNLPASLNGTKPTLLYPVLGLLIISLAMVAIVNPIFSTLNTIINDVLSSMGTANAVLLGALLAGMMSVDLGGPFNKAAYTFALGIYTDTNNGALLAAVMLGGMIPPLAIAIASTFFKNKFTAEERQSGLTNYVLGLAFVSEGAIPFATVDPMRVIGSSIIGSVVAGGLSQVFGVTMPAPHGGIFVAVLSNKPLLFVLSLVTGAIVGGLILGLWKKPITEKRVLKTEASQVRTEQS